MTWARSAPRPAKQIGGDIGPRPTARGIGLSDALAAAPVAPARVPPSPRALANEIDARGRRIKESARGKDCQVRYTGICCFDPTCTIWSHARWGAQAGDGGKGMSTKADDLAGAYACSACDAAFDQLRGIEGTGYTRESLDLDWMLGHLRSLGILQRDGIV